MAAPLWIFILHFFASSTSLCYEPLVVEDLRSLASGSIKLVLALAKYCARIAFDVEIESRVLVLTLLFVLVLTLLFP